jgi:hypothetical protein
MGKPQLADALSEARLTNGNRPANTESITPLEPPQYARTGHFKTPQNTPCNSGVLIAIAKQNRVPKEPT